ncbi:hypothetical protein MVEG_04261 [Podila verticillata NRRL 6337]|nr:hypothetical protein MVEG_04261 [Podila verticillata NRRL 6337]
MRVQEIARPEGKYRFRSKNENKNKDKGEDLDEDTSATKKELLEAIEMASIEPKITVVEHARDGEHVVIKTPSYHGKEEPMVGVW